MGAFDLADDFQVCLQLVRDVCVSQNPISYALLVSVLLISMYMA